MQLPKLSCLSYHIPEHEHDLHKEFLTSNGFFIVRNYNSMEHDSYKWIDIDSTCVAVAFSILE